MQYFQGQIQSFVEYPHDAKKKKTKKNIYVRNQEKYLPLCPLRARTDPCYINISINF